MRSLAALLAGLVLAACAGVEIKQGQGSHARRDVAPGPGLFTGEEGEFVLFRVEGDSAEDGEAGDDEPLE